MDKFLTYFVNDEEVKNISEAKNFRANSLESLALSLATSFNLENKNIAIVVPNLYDGQSLIDILANYVDKDNLLFFPYDEILRADALYSSKEFVKERIYSLFKIVENKKKHILIINSISLSHYVADILSFKNSLIKIKVGDILPPKELVNRLLDLGYTRVNKVESVFEFSYRGEIIDIFSCSSTNPIRIEYFDDEIDDIREFNAESELSFYKLKECIITPASEIIFSKKEIEKGINKLKEELSLLNKKDNEELISNTELFIMSLYASSFNDTKNRYLPYFVDKFSSIVSYLTDFICYYYRFDDVSSYFNSYLQEARSYMHELYTNHLALKNESLVFNCDLVSYSNVKFHQIIDDSSNMDVTSLPYHFTSINSSIHILDSLINEGITPYIYLKHEEINDFIKICIQNNRKIDLSLNNLGYQVIENKSFPNGFLLPKYKIALISSKEIFGVVDASSYFLKRFKEGKVISKYSDLQYGDYVVHQEQGIGIYQGIKTIDGLEYLTIQYALPDQKFYVPLNKFNLIRKYSSKDGVKPKLDILGGGSWAKRKAKIRGRISYLADKLIEIAAKRQALPGFAFQKDDELEEEFSNAFTYRLTTSQKKAWQEIKEDMMSSHPMDRLLTGDVGFGKTEVAFKAIYKCILSGKQAAFLCPTTVLSNQHYEVALKRFEGFGVNIKLLNRNVSSKEVNQTLEGLKDGSVHLVIGTHKLLSNNVKFKDLGLLVVDEEQRFGVTHKEKIKALTSNIDVLTLTATPIPRTLQMSLLNVRSLSLLDNPPNNRLPIKTYVVRFDWKLVKEVISRELARKGQVYFLHNRIDTIPKIIEKLRELFPNKTIGGVHGQEDGKDINETMDNFYEGKIDILVCTSIIETGLDVSNCNTIIVDNAQNFGLAQLYQIKGRVGRSSRLAYAYLTYPDYKLLSDDSKKRLQALKNFTELGSGYKIATEDLNIRGAGDILGKEQAGFIDSLGYDAYMQLLKDVMKEKTVVTKAIENKPTKTRFELSFTTEAHIPSNYASEHDRINIYRELYDIVTINDLNEFKKKIIDVYGQLPIEVENLFVKKEVEILLSNREIFENFIEYMDKFEIVMTKEFSYSNKISFKLQDVFSKLDEKIFTCRFLANRFKIFVNRGSEYLLDLYNIITTLISIYEK